MENTPGTDWTPLHMFLFGIEMTFAGNSGVSGDFGEFEGFEVISRDFSLHCIALHILAYPCPFRDCCFHRSEHIPDVHHVRINNGLITSNRREGGKRKLEVQMRRSMDILEINPKPKRPKDPNIKPPGRIIAYPRGETAQVPPPPISP